VGVDAELIKGSHGVFDVRVDGKVVYSKDATGRFPKAGEVAGLLAKK
jgi:selT/selW/selH-like putative selenoprotein